MLRISNVLVVSTSGKLLMKHWDDKPGDVNSGKVSAFGGGLEKGESAITAAVRVLNEETGLEIKAYDLEFLGTYYVSGAGIEDAEEHVFILAGVNEDRVHAYGGQGIKKISRGDELSGINLSAGATQYVSEYFKRPK